MSMALPQHIITNKGISLLLFLLFCCLPFWGIGQNLSNLRMGSLTIDSTVIQLDSLSILSDSFSLNGLEKEDYEVDYITARLYIKNPQDTGKVISYSYRVFTINFSESFQNREERIKVPKGVDYQPNIIPISELSYFLQDDNTLLSTGSISRGFVIGTNQNVVLNSTLNLQLSGILAENLEISANITDKNIPIQPDGNTQVIQDFDKIFVKLNYKDQLLIHAGDIDIAENSTYFMLFNKRLLGMDFISDQKFQNKTTLKNQVGGGVNKGKYVCNTINVVNGVQGPYRLTGDNDEVNIVILSGSERVYLDGQLLTRGQENDYVIDYNAGEITFTTKIIITSEKRLIIEYEYKSNYYSHYTLYTFNEFVHEKSDKWKINVNFTHDQDIKNRSLQPELQNDQKSFLSQLGDQFDDAFFPNVDTAFFNTNEILYLKIDTIVDGTLYNSVYRYSTERDTQLYRLGFTLVGDNKGNYYLSQSTVNGRVFHWIAPINGVPQGNYEPVILLSTPKLVQLGVIAAEYHFREKTGLLTEFAFSNHDQNTFSKKDDNNNLGFAIKIALSHENALKIKKEKKSPWLFQCAANYEFVHRNFYVTESYREVEFARNYNLADDYTQNNAEQMLYLKTGFLNREIGENFYHLNYFSRFNDVNALRNEIISRTNINDFNFGTATSFLISNDSIQETQFVKSDNFFSKTFKKIEIGAKDLLEYNIFLKQNSDSLRENSYAFNEAKIYIKNNDTLPYLYNISIMNRIDYITQGNRLIFNNIENEAQASFEFSKLKNNRIRGNATFRNSQMRDTTGRLSKENFLLASFEYSGRFFKNAIVISTYYEAGSGMEQKKTFTYLRVAEGQGTHTWNDYNGNGIEELDEFEIAAFQDEANYIRVWINTQEYTLTYNNKFTQTIQLRPGNVWQHKTGFLKFLSRFSDAATFTSFQKNRVQNSLAAFNPFQFNIEDSLLVRSTLNFINNLSFNQLSKYWGIDYVVQQTQNKDLLYYGFESSRLGMQEVIIRGNPHQNIGLKCNYIHSVKTTHSEYLDSRNYAITSDILENSVELQFKNAFFGTIGYHFKNKSNKLGSEASIHHQFLLTLSYRMAGKGSFTGNVQYINISYKGETNNSISYEMLEGLNNGHNMVWNVAYQTNITDYLQVELSYNGRFSSGNKAIHTGNLQLRAHF